MRAYDHVQRGYVSWLLALIAIALGVAAGATGDQPPVPLLLGLGGLLFALLALSFHRLRVHDDGDAVRIAFGPLPLFRKRLRYSEIARVEAGRSTVLDGWGIHYVPGRGWTWNRAACRSSRRVHDVAAGTWMQGGPTTAPPMGCRGGPTPQTGPRRRAREAASELETPVDGSTEAGPALRWISSAGRRTFVVDPPCGDPASVDRGSRGLLRQAAKGLGCAVVTLRSGATLRIGSDEPEALARFLDEAARMRGSGPV